MNNKFFKIIGISIFVIGGLFLTYKFTFGASSKMFKLIPLESDFVYKINFKQLISKLDIEKLKESFVYSLMEKEKDKEAEDFSFNFFYQLVKSPKESGIDFSTNGYGYSFEKGNGSYMAFAFAIDDKNDFDAYVKKCVYDTAKISTKGKLTIIKIDSRNMFGYNGKYGIFLNTIETDRVRENPLEMALVYLFDLYGKENFTNNKNAKKLSKLDGDMVFLLDYKELLKDVLGYNFGKSSKSKNKGDYEFSVLSAISFENDRINIESDLLFDTKEALLKFEPIVAKHGITKAQLPFLTNEKILGMMTLSVNYTELIERLGKEYEKQLGLNDKSLREFGLTSEEYKNLFVGDLSVTLLELKNKTEDYNTYEYNEQDKTVKSVIKQRANLRPVLSATVLIKDQTIFKKMMKNLCNKNPECMTPEFGQFKSKYERYASPFEFYYCVNGDYFTIINDSALAYKLKLDGKLGTPPENVKQLATENTFSFFLDLNYKNYPDEFKSQYLRKIYSEPMANDVLGSLSSFSVTANKQHSTMVLELTKQDQNSLFRIFNLIDKFAKQNEEKEKEINDRIQKEREEMESEAEAPEVTTESTR